MLLTPDSEPPGATGESTISHMHKTIHMWMGQGQNVKGFRSGLYGYARDCSGKPLARLLLTETRSMSVHPLALQTLFFSKLDSVALSRG